MRREVWVAVRSSPGDRIPVRPEHPRHPELVRLTPQIVDSPLPQPAIVPQCLDGDIDADLVAELEAVHDGPGGTGHADGNALDVVLVDAGS